MTENYSRTSEMAATTTIESVCALEPKSCALRCTTFAIKAGIQRPSLERMWAKWNQLGKYRVQLCVIDRTWGRLLGWHTHDSEIAARKAAMSSRGLGRTDAAEHIITRGLWRHIASRLPAKCMMIRDQRRSHQLRRKKSMRPHRGYRHMRVLA